MIICITTAKGGPGKTTTASNLAVCLAQDGHDVCCIDADEIMALTKWFSYRDSGVEIHNSSMRGDISRSLKNIHSRYEIVIVDLHGGITPELITAMLVSDLLLCPMEPSQLDIDTLPDFFKEIDKARLINSELEVRYFLSRCQPLTTMDNAIEVGEMLSEMEEVNLLKTRICINKRFIDAFPLGKGVVEMENADKAKENFLQFYKEVKELIQ